MKNDADYWFLKNHPLQIKQYPITPPSGSTKPPSAGKRHEPEEPRDAGRGWLAGLVPVLGPEAGSPVGREGWGGGSAPRASAPGKQRLKNPRDVHPPPVAM